MDKTSRGGPTGRGGRDKLRPGGSGYPLEVRKRAVEEILRRGARHGDVARAYGIGTSTLSAWIRAYRLRGIEGLRAAVVPAPKVAERRPDVKRQAVGAVRREHPDYGTRRIRDVLARFEALGERR